MHNSLSCLNLLVSFGTFCDSCVILQKQTKKDEFLEDHKAVRHGHSIPRHFDSPMHAFWHSWLHVVYDLLDKIIYAFHLFEGATRLWIAMAHLPNLQRNLKEIHDYIDLQWDICRELTYLFTSAKGSSHPSLLRVWSSKLPRHVSKKVPVGTKKKRCLHVLDTGYVSSKPKLN